jgi:hypothetical protein
MSTKNASSQTLRPPKWTTFWRAAGGTSAEDFFDTAPVTTIPFFATSRRFEFVSQIFRFQKASGGH